MTVWLVGAGPGDPGLLTRRGAEALATADVVLYDSLAEASLLDLAPDAAERVFVGKRPGAPMDQDEINARLVELGRAGKRVVRLKGGDPFVFGRGGEEAQALLDAGVPFEVVPGVTAAVGVPAYAGIPVTHRGIATSFTVVTGHSRHEADTETNWEALAEAGGTIVVLMGVAHRSEIARRLMAGGLAPSTPVAAIQWGTRPDQRTLRTTLDALANITLEPPVTLVIGGVAALDLVDAASRPLAGKRVVVTRAREQASVLVARLRELGADVVELPTIRVTDPDDGGAALRRSAGEVGAYDWVVFASTNAADRFMDVVADARALGGVKVAAVGAATADALRRRGIVADLVPARFVSDALVEEFPTGAGRVLIPRAAVARDVLPDGLRTKGWAVETVDAYRTVAAEVDPSRAAGADAVTFSSASTVTHFMELGLPAPPVIVCIGPVTAAAAEAAGLHVDAVAQESTIAGLVDAVLAALPPGRP